MKDKIIYIFNTYYCSLIKEVKHLNEKITNEIKKHYKILDKASDEHITFFSENIKIADVRADNLGDKQVFKNITSDMILEGFEDKQKYWNQIYTLLTLTLLYDNVNNDSRFPADNILTLLNNKQKGMDVSEDMATIVDEDLSYVLDKIVVESQKDQDILGMMGNSKIANLAKEISDDIDVSKLDVKGPEDIFKLMDFSSSNNVLGDIIQKVSSKIQGKISNGELKQEDLFGEAMNMMNMMNMGGNMMSNPMMNNILKAMKNGNANVREDVVRRSAARERLRAKLAKK